MFIPTYPDNPSICPVRTLNNYLFITTYFRSDDKNLENKVFRSISQPEKCITARTFARWVTSCIKSAYPELLESSLGHSTRGVGSTIAFTDAGLSLQDIMNGAGWKSDSIFKDFYLNPNYNPSFGRAALRLNRNEARNCKSAISHFHFG